MADVADLNRSEVTRVVGADPSTGAETYGLVVTPNNEARINNSSHVSGVQAAISVSGANVTAYANVNNTVGGNLSERKLVRVHNIGKQIIWRINGQLSSGVGEPIGKSESVEFAWDHNIVILLQESNTDNELNFIVTEVK